VTAAPLAPLATALTGVGRLVDSLPDDAWDRPTPCSDWTVRQLLGHLIGGNRLVARAVSGEPLRPPEQLGQRDPADQLGDDPRAAWHASAEDLLTALGAPGALERTYTVPAGTFPGAVIVHLRVVETLVHGWDLARATGGELEVPDELAAAELAFSTDLLSRLPSGRTPFAPSRPVAEGAPALDRLVALLGREPERTQTGGRSS
jgi:uncharacterized protein (TIGR03086 family)